MFAAAPSVATAEGRETQRKPGLFRLKHDSVQNLVAFTAEKEDTMATKSPRVGLLFSVGFALLAALCTGNRSRGTAWLECGELTEMGDSGCGVGWLTVRPA